MAADKAAPENHDTPRERRLAEVRRRLAALRQGNKPGEQADVDKGECTWPRNLNDDQQQEEAGE